MAQPDLAAVPPGGELEPRERVDRHRVGVDAADVAEGDVRRRSARSSAQTRSHSPGRSARAIGPPIAKAIVCGAGAAICRRDRSAGAKLIGAATDEFCAAGAV